MGSSFTWLDFSEHDRRRALDVIDLFREKDTIDELGLGTVRDAIADILFPGLSTIQTRAKYFLFIPWIFRSLEDRRVRSADFAKRARDEEVRLINALAESDDTDGVIGFLAREKLRRLPSNVYWQGLGKWGIRLFPGSQDQYHRYLDRYYAARQRARVDSADSADAATRLLPNWHPGLPPASEGFPREASFALSRVEAEYLRERIVTHVPESLLAYLVEHGEVTEEVSFPWQHPQVGDLPATLAWDLRQARYFSSVMFGTSLLYKLMLAEASGRDDLVDFYEQGFASWAESAEEEGWHAWDRQAFWAWLREREAQPAEPTRRFIDTWVDAVLAEPSLGRLVRRPAVRRLIQERELALKKARARLTYSRALELWGGQSGGGQMDFRWFRAQTIVRDILKGLGRDANA